MTPILPSGKLYSEIDGKVYKALCPYTQNIKLCKIITTNKELDLAYVVFEGEYTTNVEFADIENFDDNKPCAMKVCVCGKDASGDDGRHSTWCPMYEED